MSANDYGEACDFEVCLTCEHYCNMFRCTLGPKRCYNNDLWEKKEMEL